MNEPIRIETVAQLIDTFGQPQCPIEIPEGFDAESYWEYERLCRIAYNSGREMAEEEGNTEYDNPYDTPGLRDSWSYGFHNWRSKNKPKPKLVKVDWKEEGF